MKKIFVMLALVIITAGLSSGCWSRKELSELAIVLGAGVDRAPGGQVVLTLQLARPKGFAGGGGDGSGGKEPSTWVVSETGSTVFEAQRKLANRLSRRIYWAHNAVLIFGEDAARHGIRRYTNFFSRSAESRENMWVMVARGKAKDILETSDKLEDSSAQQLAYIIRNGFICTAKFFCLKEKLAAEGSNPVACRVEVMDQGTIPDTGEGKPMKHMGAGITGMAVFRDEKLAGWLDELESQGLLWITGEVRKGTIVTPSPSEPDKRISINIFNMHTKVEPHYDGKSARFCVKIVADGELEEQQSREDITEYEVRRDIEKNFAGEIENRARLALEKVQGEYAVDVFDFGEVFHRKYPKEWAGLKDRWDEVFASAPVDIAVEAHIRYSGLTSARESLETP